MDPKVIRGTSCWLGVYALRSVIRLFVMAAFLGYIMVWIMMPTNTFWLHWLPDIHAKTDSKYFGQQGLVPSLYSRLRKLAQKECSLQLLASCVVQVPTSSFIRFRSYSLLLWAVYISTQERNVLIMTQLKILDGLYGNDLCQ